MDCDGTNCILGQEVVGDYQLHNYKGNKAAVDLGFYKKQKITPVK